MTIGHLTGCVKSHVLRSSPIRLTKDCDLSMNLTKKWQKGDFCLMRRNKNGDLKLFEFEVYDNLVKVISLISYAIKNCFELAFC